MKDEYSNSLFIIFTPNYILDSGPENTAVSPQERMKAKMQERAKKKTAEKYTVSQLLEKVTHADLLGVYDRENGHISTSCWVLQDYKKCITQITM